MLYDQIKAQQARANTSRMAIQGHTWSWQISTDTAGVQFSYSSILLSNHDIKLEGNTEPEPLRSSNVGFRYLQVLKT